MNIQKAAKWFGIILILVGILGFVPGVTTDEGLLLGIFKVDAVHNVIHLLSGIIALFCAGNAGSARSYFIIFGIVYGLVAVIGFVQHDHVLGVFSINNADNILHVAITLFALVLGFTGPKRSAPVRAM